MRLVRQHSIWTLHFIIWSVHSRFDCLKCRTGSVTTPFHAQCFQQSHSILLSKSVWLKSYEATVKSSYLFSPNCLLLYVTEIVFHLKRSADALWQESARSVTMKNLLVNHWGFYQVNLKIMTLLGEFFWTSFSILLHAFQSVRVAISTELLSLRQKNLVER